MDNPASPLLLPTDTAGNAPPSLAGITTPSPSPGPEASGPALPLPLTASVMLADLPRDAASALAGAGAFPAEAKVLVKFKAVGSAPQLAQDVCKISAGRKFEEVVRYLRRKVRCGERESVFLYVNQAFAPSLDEVVGNLHQCFRNAQDQLVVAYSMTPAFG